MKGFSKRNKFHSFIRNNQSGVISLLAFAALLFGTFRYTIYKKGQWEKDIRNNLLENLIAKKSSLEKALYSRIYYTRGIAGFVSLNPAVTHEEFAHLAAEFIKGDSVINSMALSKDCVIGAIYPLEGHEEAIGLDLLAHPERREIVEKTIETRKTFVAGPVVLVEGGIAFISYTPVFDKTTAGAEKFWGICDIVVLQNKLLQEAGLLKNEDGINYALRGYNGKGMQGDIFWGIHETFNDNPVTIHIELPYGSWVMAASPARGWGDFLDQDRFLTTILFFSVFVISVLIYLFTRAVVRLKINEKNLRQATKRLAESNTLKDKLFSIISHDLRNPLGTFHHLTDILLSEYDEINDEKRKEMIGALKESSISLYSLLENLLEWSKTQQANQQPNQQRCYLFPLCQDLIQLMKQSANLKDIKIINNINHKHYAFCDNEMTKTILRNLISNALKFTPAGGSINITSELNTINHKDFVSILIEDTGIGISEPELDSLFKLDKTFSRIGTNNEQGTGIGLVISTEFAEKQGGILKVKSKAGEGSVFTLMLPLQ